MLRNLDIAPGHAEKLLAAESVRRSEVVEKVHKQLANFLNSPDVRAAYDAVVIDTAPSKGHSRSVLSKRQRTSSFLL